MRLVEVSAMNLRPGMFVAELDRPWLDTPFSIQGFTIRDDDDVLFVARHVDHVYIDADYRGSNVFLPQTPDAHQEITGSTLSLKADFAQAKVTFASAADTLDSVFKSLHDGMETDMDQVKAAVRPLIDGVFKNSAAVAALARLKESGEYRYNHSIAMSVWAAILGRHVGLHRDELEKLVTGCAMCDVGMTQLPQKVFDHPQSLDEAQYEQIRSHPELGTQLLKNSKNVDLEVLMIVEAHHERHDGSGYPRNLAGNEIPLLARIAGLVDTYDAMISAQPHAPVRTSFDAIQELLDAKNQLFQGALVEQFVQSIGLFPVSALVELNSGEVGIVVTQNPTRRLKPELLVVLDAEKTLLQKYELINLSDAGLTGEQARWIVRELPPGSYNVNSQDFLSDAASHNRCSPATSQMSVVAAIEVSNTDELKAEHGEETYNMLHAELVERLRTWIRKQDQLVVDKSGRICALLKGLSEQGQINLAANKLTRITAPLYDCFGEKVHLPVSAGFALTLPSGDTREAALARAGAALAQAGQNANGWATFNAESNSIRQDEYKLLLGLKRGLERGEFVLFYQPKVNAAYRTLTGAEALIRWIPDGKTTIGPDHFISKAERHGLIKPMSLWAVKCAIARCARWQGDIGVAVNLPPTVLEDDDLYSTVKDCLALHDIDAARLTLEVTESVMAENHADVLQTLTRLRSLGVRISIDDFGTGYSSLACFRDMPADELKIDKCFVQAMEKSKVDQAIIRTIIELAKNFALQIVAEGVEDDATADTLLEMGCHVLQGYFVDKPLPPDDFEKRHQLVDT